MDPNVEKFHTILKYLFRITEVENRTPSLNLFEVDFIKYEINRELVKYFIDDFVMIAQNKSKDQTYKSFYLYIYMLAKYISRYFFNKCHISLKYDANKLVLLEYCLAFAYSIDWLMCEGVIKFNGTPKNLTIEDGRLQIMIDAIDPHNFIDTIGQSPCFVIGGDKKITFNYKNTASHIILARLKQILLSDPREDELAHIYFVYPIARQINVLK